MIKKIWALLTERGYAIMLVGMAIVVVAAVLLVRSKQGGPALDSYVWPVAIAGLAVYVVGRIAVAARNKGMRKGPNRPDSDSR